jgi:hypothetical protein
MFKMVFKEMEKMKYASNPPTFSNTCLSYSSSHPIPLLPNDMV